MAKQERNSTATQLSIPRLRADFPGRVIAPGDAGYDQARAVFYGGLDKRPAVIIRARDAGEVARVIALAHETGLELAVRSGGHSNAGYGVTEGGIVLDLSQMKALEIDAAQRTAWAQPGLTAEEYSQAVAAHGLATGFGDAGTVGLGGITLGGGVGYLVRKHGLTIDNLLAAEIVTADGQIRQVNSQSEPDLFWAIRGGGGNFGVATRFQYRLQAVDGGVGGMLILPASPEVLTAFVALAEEAPEELSTIANVMNAPPMPFLPPEVHGKLVLMAMMFYSGDAAAGLRALAPFRALAAPLADLLRPLRYLEMFPPEEDSSYHPIAAGRTMFVDGLDGADARLIIDRLRASTAMMAVAQIRVLGGAMARVPVDATAFAHRQRKIMVNLAALYTNPGDALLHEQWVDEFMAALRKDTSGAYVNFLAAEGEARVREAYPAATWERLVAVKRRYDPDNLFRLNQNIPPAQQGSSTKA
jgi:FAD/FMN-containing dehydrogenase